MCTEGVSVKTQLFSAGRPRRLLTHMQCAVHLHTVCMHGLWILHSPVVSMCAGSFPCWIHEVGDPALITCQSRPPEEFHYSRIQERLSSVNSRSKCFKYWKEHNVSTTLLTLHKKNCYWSHFGRNLIWTLKWACHDVIGWNWNEIGLYKLMYAHIIFYFTVGKKTWWDFEMMAGHHWLHEQCACGVEPVGFCFSAHTNRLEQPHSPCEQHGSCSSHVATASVGGNKLQSNGLQ